MDGRFFMQYLKDSPEARERLSYVFERMCAEGTLERTFYDGTVRTRDEFLADVLQIGSLPFLVFWEGRPAGSPGTTRWKDVPREDITFFSKLSGAGKHRLLSDAASTNIF